MCRKRKKRREGEREGRRDRIEQETGGVPKSTRMRESVMVLFPMPPQRKRDRPPRPN